ncbi:MAG: GntR family transcriptional regulator [Phycisphaeraceae bacterium JB051]
MKPIPPSQTPMPTIATGRSPLYMEAARLIKQRIKHGEYPANTLLPSIRQLSKSLGLSHNAVQRAIQQLETERIVESQHGIGVKVLTAEDCAKTAHWIALVQPYHSLASVTLQRGLEQAMEDRSNFCVVKTSDNDPRREQQIINHLIDNGINGLLLWPVDNDDNSAYLNQVVKRVPTVLVDRLMPEVNAPAVVHDYDQAGREMVDYLASKQCKNIMVICDPVAIPTFDELKNAISDQCKKHGVIKGLAIAGEPVLQIINQCQDGDFTLAAQRAQVIGPMLTSGKYDAVICPQDQYLNYVLAQHDWLDMLGDMPIVSFRHLHTSRDLKQMHRANITNWMMDQLGLFHQAITLLDEGMIKGNMRHRVVRQESKRLIK